MFSGIVEEMATLVAIEKYQENIDFTMKCSFIDELKIDQSISHNGVCLTVVSIKDDTYTTTAMKETLDRTMKLLFVLLWMMPADLLTLLLNIIKTRQWHIEVILLLTKAL
jgi:hypothetical protein